MENRIAAFGLEHEQYVIAEVFSDFNGIQIEHLNQKTLESKTGMRQILDYIKMNVKVLIMKDVFWSEELDELQQLLLEEAPHIPVIPIGSEVIGRGIGNISAENVQRINGYFIYGGVQNIANAMYFIRSKYLEEKETHDIPMPMEVPFDGIFHPATQEIFQTLDAYLRWFDGYVEQQQEKRRFEKRIGLLIHRSSWVAGNLAVERQLIAEMEKRNICVVPVFYFGSQEPELKTKTFDEMFNSYYCMDGTLSIDALVNMQLFALAKDSASKNVFEHMAGKLKELNIPVYRPLISFAQDIKTWDSGMEGLGQEISWAFTVPEREGMIEPLIIGYRNDEGKAEPIQERIEKFASRIERWAELRRKENQNKKLAVFLHNAPCSGVEATIGAATGLDAFESVINILNRLKREGWSIDEIPESGKELRELVMKRKAYSDFRWTSVEDIIACGGSIYQMPLQGQCGYLQYYDQLDQSCREEMKATWGEPPGEGMVFNQKLVITGVEFGNVVVMVQPKRGCYGAKCTGEVCKLLQDPSCPPPHQYFATYKYVEKVFKADAVLHVGTHGSLEFLPGKTNAMSGRCYPDIVLGDLPNLYIYHAGVAAEALLAKRRSYALTIGHLPSVYESIGADAMQLVGLIGEYLDAAYLKSPQTDVLEVQLKQCIAKVKGADAIINGEASFCEGIVHLRSVLRQSMAKPRNERLHQFGKNPVGRDVINYIYEVVMSDETFITRISEAVSKEEHINDFIWKFIEQIVNGSGQETAGTACLCAKPLGEEHSTDFDFLAMDIRSICKKLENTGEELDQLVSALSGGYVPPGPSGMPDGKGREIIPTGRNLYLMDIDRIPTQAAYAVGSKAAEELIEQYRKDEGRLPEKIAMNMISLDISRSKGEQLSQILYLMGITPIWDKRGKVIGLEAISVGTLGRPRIDVTVRISGVLRDSFPEAIELMDEAVVLAASLPEDEEANYIKRNTARIAKMLKKAGIEEDIENRAKIRIFGDRPGAYGAGVDLALKASAWKDEADLAKTFIYFSSFAYGKKVKGISAMHEFVENVKDTDVSYDTTNSKRYDILASNFGASVQGGFGLVGKMLAGKEIRQYHGSDAKPGEIRVQALDEKLKEALEETLLNPIWKENAKEMGYEGGAQLMHRMQNVFEWQCLTEKLEDSLIDQVVEAYVNDKAMQQWFKEYNPYALEEASRRFLELHQRGKWNPQPDVLEKLKESFLAIEGDMEEILTDSKGEKQASAIDIITDSDVKTWNHKLAEVNKLFEAEK